MPFPRLTATFNPLTVVHATTNKPDSCLFESTSSGPVSIHYHLINSTRTNEEAKAELYEAQTWLLQNGAPLCILANQDTASTYLSNHHLALVELLRITSHLSAVVQALLYSIEEPSPPPTP